MAIVPIDDFPGPVPSRNNPATFNEDIDVFLAHLQTFVDQVNAIAASINADVDLIAYRDAAIAAQLAAETARDQAVAIVGGEFVSYGSDQSLSAPEQAQARDNIGAVIGVNVQAYDANLSPTARNRIINPSSQIYQRTAAATADDAYTGMPDRWYALTQTAAITPSQLTDVGSGTPFMARLTQAQAAAQRMGMAQIIEAADCKDLRGQSVAFSARIRSSLSQPIRYAILEWTGTADAVTSDVVNSWTNAAFTAGQFFVSTTTNVLAVGVVTPSAAALTDLTAITATVGASANNLIVLIWSEGTLAQNATLDIAQAQLARGSATPAYAARAKLEETRLCLRFYWSTPALGYEGHTQAAATKQRFPYPVPMRTTPTITQTGSVVASALTAATTFTDAGAGYTDGNQAVLGFTTNGTGIGSLWRPVQFDAEL